VRTISARVTSTPISRARARLNDRHFQAFSFTARNVEDQSVLCMFDASIVSVKYPGRASRCVVSGAAMPRRHSASRSRGSLSQRDAQSTAKHIPATVSGSVNAPGRVKSPMDGDSISQRNIAAPKYVTMEHFTTRARQSADARESVNECRIFADAGDVICTCAALHMNAPRI